MLLLHHLYKQLFCLLLLAIVCLQTAGQELIYSANTTPSSNPSNSFFGKQADTVTYPIKSPLYTGFEYIPAHLAATGSPFLFSDSTGKGTLNYFSRNYTNITFQYDIENDQVVLFSPYPPYRLVLITEAIHAFDYEGHHFIQKQDIAAANAEPGFFELLLNGKNLRLLAAHRKITEEKIKELQVNIKYRQQVSYYLLYNQQFIAISSTSDLLNALPDQRQQLASFIKQQHIRKKNPTAENLISLLQFYESLSQ